jgi:hypothetical protein
MCWIYLWPRASFLDACAGMARRSPLLFHLKPIFEKCLEKIS